MRHRHVPLLVDVDVGLVEPRVDTIGGHEHRGTGGGCAARRLGGDRRSRIVGTRTPNMTATPAITRTKRPCLIHFARTMNSLFLRIGSTSRADSIKQQDVPRKLLTPKLSV